MSLLLMMMMILDAAVGDVKSVLLAVESLLVADGHVLVAGL